MNREGNSSPRSVRFLLTFSNWNIRTKFHDSAAADIHRRSIANFRKIMFKKAPILKNAFFDRNSHSIKEKHRHHACNAKGAKKLGRKKLSLRTLQNSYRAKYCRPNRKIKNFGTYNGLEVNLNALRSFVSFGALKIDTINTRWSVTSLGKKRKNANNYGRFENIRI